MYSFLKPVFLASNYWIKRIFIVVPQLRINKPPMFLRGWGGLVVRSRPCDRRVPGSKPNTTEDPPCIEPVARQIIRRVSNTLPSVRCKCAHTGPAAYRHSVLEQSTIVTLEGSDWTNESDITLLHIASTVRHAYLV
ncbi:hypothetical protein AVEN_194481-1 [Araneus ventricosus]|uniref:Uncharacterized protein n=1 Tax=Araneus ventricosus TaxID=182803 RepID=A0A4Y2A5W0_ARAVE|nr:hypothetical protein AVEN_194481-1 [Araneus ventricosus]